jgi:hypothetical protein
MPNKVLLKKSSVAAKVPLVTDLDYGELALNYTDGRLYYKDGANAIQVIASTASTSGQFTVPSVISVNSSTEALRITQIGSGDALRVEDAANPDTTPFRISSDGLVLVGGPPVIGGASTYPVLQVTGYGDGSIGANAAAMGINGFLPSGAGGYFAFNRSNSATVGTNATVVNGDQIGRIVWSGADGTNYIRAAQISVEVDGVPGTNSMPGRLIFATTASGQTSSTGRMVITGEGIVGIGTTNPVTGTRLNIGSTYLSAGGYSAGISLTGTVPVATTISHSNYASLIYIQDPGSAGNTIPNVIHFETTQPNAFVNTVVTNQIGFRAGSNLTGAANNYGFYGNIPSGTGRWNFYAAGTADNYFGGPIKLGQTYYSNIGIGIFYAPASVAATGIYQDPTINSATTSSYTLNSTYPTTAAASFTLGTLTHYNANQGTLGAGSTITNQYGFSAGGGLTGATNNYGFYGNIPSGTGRWNFYANGTASNYFAGNVNVGTTGGDFSRTWRFVARQDQNDVSQFGFINATVGANAAVQIAKIGGTGNNFLNWALFDNNGAPYDAFNYGSAVTHVVWTLGGSERLRVNSTGTVSIAGAPPTATITSKLYTASDITLAGANRSILGNLYYDTGWKYTGNGYGWGIREDNTGKVQFIRAGNNTGGANAAATVTLSDLITLDLVNNRIGMGTNAPGAKLEVYGDTILGGTTSAGRRLSIDANGVATFKYNDNSLATLMNWDNLELAAGANHGVLINCRFGTDVSQTPINAARIAVAKEQIWTSTATTQDSYMSFSTTLDGTLGEKVRITSSGSVGIGTTSPTTILHINDTAATGTGLRVSGGGSGTALAVFERTVGASGSSIEINASSNDPQIKFARSGSGTYNIGVDEDGSLRFAANNTIGLANDRVVVTSGGNVGIGTTAPGYKLEVNGSFAATTKSFLITHPTKPNMKLRHGSLEGPEHGVYVRGRLKGKVIELPEYWTKLVDPDSITVQLTAIGKGQKLYVEDIRDNKVYIANDGMFAGDPNCFYLVQAERVDIEKMNVEIEVQ